MAVMTSAGSTLAISASLPATYDAAGFQALTLTTVGSVDNIGEFGRQYNLVSFNPVATRGTQKFKGSYNAGTLNVTAALDDGDAGQDIVEMALDDDNDYSFAVTLQDGTIYYFIGKVMSYTTNVSGVDNITMATINIELTTDVSGNDIIKTPAV